MRIHHLLVVVIAAIVAASGLAIAAKGGSSDDHRKDADREKGKPDREGDDRDDRRGKHAEYRKHGDKWLLRNDDISVWFHQAHDGRAKPMLKVFHTDADGNVTGYKVKIKRVCEVDANATGCGGAHARVNLDKANHWNTAVARDEANGTLTITMLLTDAQGIVGLVFHLDDNASSVKFDLTVDNWRWTPGDHALGLLMTVERKSFGDEEADADDANLSTAGGYVAWESYATANHGGNDSRTLNVTAFVEPEEDDEDDDGKEARIFLRFDGDPGYGSLDYDPTLGVASAASGPPGESFVPAFGLLAAAAAVGAGALLRARVRRVP